MSAVTLPPIGAKIRTTTRHDGGATVVIEGIVTAHPTDRVGDDPWVIVGEGEGVTAYVEDWPGAKVTVEVLQMPLPTEPPDHAVVLIRPGVRASDPYLLMWRDDARARLNDDPEQHWFYPTRAGIDTESWNEVTSEHPGQTVTLLVPDPAADAPTLPFVCNDGDGNTLEVRVDPAEHLVEIAAAPAGAARNPAGLARDPAVLVRMSGMSAGILGAVLLRAEQEAKRR